MLYKNINSIDDGALLQKYLENLHEWSIKNGIRFNALKSNICVFTSKSVHFSAGYDLGGESLITVDVVKYLGVHLQKNLKWDVHINFVLNSFCA
jgi:hypothetical protein